VAWPPRFLFIAGRLCLDFLHTGGKGTRARWERWGSARELADWMESCPQLRVRPALSGADLGSARELREAIWHGAQAVLRQEPVPATSVHAINAAAAEAPLVPALHRGTSAWTAGATGPQVLSTVARDAVELFGGELREKLRACRNPRCFLLFVDQSRSGRRAWCNMGRCGNLEKISRYRARQKKSAGKREGESA
jgi:predicted RNA-binding Zn ribbon-like protein